MRGCVLCNFSVIWVSVCLFRSIKITKTREAGLLRKSVMMIVPRTERAAAAGTARRAPDTAAREPRAAAAATSPTPPETDAREMAPARRRERESGRGGGRTACAGAAWSRPDSLATAELVRGHPETFAWW
jgi:hypothetical protein